jgi:leader peptidase (prepilin peptidase)/N-methyltransferase
MWKSNLSFVIILSAAAAVIGSFLGTLILRLPVGEPVLLSRSECPHCHQRLGIRDLIPLVSWVALRKRCRACDTRIGLFYPLIELSAIAVALWAATLISGWLLAASCILGWTLLTLAAIDWQHQLLPNELTLPLIPAGIIVAYFVDQAAIIDHVIGAVAGFCFFEVVAWGYQWWRGRVGLGGGDVKLLAGLGAWVGWIGLPTIILLSTFAALTATLVRGARGGGIRATDRLSLGSYLAVAGWIVWLYGPLVPA